MRGQTVSPRVQRSEPPYMQVTDYFRRKIQDGELPEGTKLPTVADIESEWQVARATAAKAIAQLQVEGLIISSPRGSFVAAKASKASTPYDRVMRLRRTGTLDAVGEHHRVTSASVVDAPAYVADLLDIEPGAPVVRREFVTVADKSIRALSVTWYPAALAEEVPELLATETSAVGHLLGRLEAKVGAVTRGRDFYHARGADAREASSLGLPVGAAILANAWLLWSSSDQGDRLIEYGESCLPPRATISYPYEIPSEVGQGAEDGDVDG
jgi:GntR family transcriptional regulator